MKRLILFSAILCLLISCKKSPEDSETPECYTLTQIDGWTKINFKSNYTIQVPEGFEGRGMVGFEGYTFSKNSADHKINLDYGYCNSGLFCSNFGDPLTNPTPKSILIQTGTSSSVTTNKLQYFCQNTDTIGLLYYIDNDNANGRLYWKDNNTFKAGLDVSFSLTEFHTLNKIIGSIEGK